MIKVTENPVLQHVSAISTIPLIYNVAYIGARGHPQKCSTCTFCDHWLTTCLHRNRVPTLDDEALVDVGILISELVKSHNPISNHHPRKKLQLDP
jgi:hypothetical protein